VKKLKENKRMLKEKKFEEGLTNAKLPKLLYKIIVSISSN